AGLLGGGGEPLLAQPVDRTFEIALGLTQRLLAVHHARAGLLAQLLHQSGGDLGHGFRPSSLQSFDTETAAPAAAVPQGLSAAGQAVPAASSAGASAGAASAGTSAEAPISTPEALISAWRPSSTDPDTRSQYK